MTKRAPFLCLLLMALAAGVSCSGNSSSSRPGNGADYADPSIHEFANLGFLGAAGHGATRSVAVPDPERPGGILHTGGVVLREVEEGSIAENSGLEPGDVVVRVVEDYLPDKEDPTLDFMARLESAYGAGKTEIPIAFLRAGRLEEGEIRLDPKTLPPAGGGDFTRSERFAFAAGKGLDALKRMQRPDGSFPIGEPAAAGAAPNPLLAVTSLAGLAFLGAGALPGAPECGKALEGCLEYVESALDREDTDPVGAAFAVIFLSECVGKKPDPSLFAPLAKGAGKILAGQEENGGWRLGGKEGNEAGYNESTLATQWCLLALGTAERAGVEIDNAPFEKACRFLKEKTEGGRVGFKPVAGFDRRSEAGRLAGVLAALAAASCSLDDPYAQKLFGYYGKHEKEIARAPLDEALLLFPAALLSREKGLPQWSLFVRDNQVPILSLQKTDGSFASLPKAKKKRLPFFDALAGPAWRTAAFTIILLLQDDPFPLLAAKGPEGWTKRRDGDGKVLSAAQAASSGGEARGKKPKAMQFKSVEEAVEFLKKMGMDENDPQIKKLEELAKKKKKK